VHIQIVLIPIVHNVCLVVNATIKQEFYHNEYLLHNVIDTHTYHSTGVTGIDNFV